MPKRDRHGHFLPPMVYVGMHIPAESHRLLKSKAALDKVTIEQAAAALVELYARGEIELEKSS